MDAPTGRAPEAGGSPAAASGPNDERHRPTGAALRALKRVMMLYRQLASRAFAEVGVHPGQAACLLALGRGGEMSQRDLARRLLVSAPTVTGMVKRLEHAGFVERRIDERDQRLLRIRLTPRGDEVVARLHAVFEKQTEMAFAGMEADQVEALTRLLARIEENLARAVGREAAEPSGSDGV
ncbi:MAG: MarR family transcriptional regulator [Coriobacteriia bacterium]|nr:MarR family transcriptional regulator [Coriobacteriia bacterium]